MADAKLTALTAASALAAADLFYVSQSAASRKATGTQLLTLVGTTYVPLAGGTMTGALTIASGTLTASAPALNVTQTWTTGATFTARVMNITDTSSNAASLFEDYQVGGVSKLQIRKDGAMLVRPLTINTTSMNFYNTSYGIGIDNSAIAIYAYTTSATLNLRQTSLVGTIGLSFDAGQQAIWFGNFRASTGLVLDAAATLAQRNGTTQQIFRVYNTTDAGLTNYERLTLTGVAGTSVNLTAETLGTGGDNLDIVLTPAGTGKVTFGTHSALAAETVTGYITIKDAGGTTRKLAVVS